MFLAPIITMCQTPINLLVTELLLIFPSSQKMPLNTTVCDLSTLASSRVSAHARTRTHINVFNNLLSEWINKYVGWGREGGKVNQPPFVYKTVNKRQWVSIGVGLGDICTGGTVLHAGCPSPWIGHWPEVKACHWRTFNSIQSWIVDYIQWQ